MKSKEEPPKQTGVYFSYMTVCEGGSDTAIRRVASFSLKQERVKRRYFVSDKETKRPRTGAYFSYVTARGREVDAGSREIAAFYIAASCYIIL